MRLVLIRHAESHHGQRGVIGGPIGCTGLTDHGVTQARALADRLRATGELANCAALLCSPWPRARQTAEVLMGVLPDATFAVDDDLCELRPGAADGLTWEECRARFGQFDLAAEPERPFAPDGESWSAFVGRVRTTTRRLSEQYAGQTVVAVSHAGLIVVTFLLLFDLIDRRSSARIDPVHTGLTEWRVTGGTGQLVRYNDATHLGPLTDG